MKGLIVKKKKKKLAAVPKVKKTTTQVCEKWKFIPVPSPFFVYFRGCSWVHWLKMDSSFSRQIKVDNSFFYDGLGSRRSRKDEVGEEKVGGRGGGRWGWLMAPPGGRMKHQVHSATSLTIIKMLRLKGDILNLRLFVSIKRVYREHRRPYKTNTLRER